jgi:hypothetical protein
MEAGDSSVGGLITDSFVRLVESNGCEIGVTVVVGGTVIEGVMCPVARLAEWQTETINRFLLGEGNSFAATDMPPPTPQRKEAVRADFEERTRGYREQHGTDAPMSFRTFALRNAIVHTGSDGSQWTHHPYLLVDAQRVAAIALGTPSPM